MNLSELNLDLLCPPVYTSFLIETLMRRFPFSKFTKLFVLFLGVVALAQADLIGFSGAYDPANWTLSNVPVNLGGIVGGSVDTSGAPASIVLRGGNNGLYNVGWTTWTIAAPASGLVSFDWSYLSYDGWGPAWDPAGWVLNGAYTQLSGGGANSQSGSASFSVTAGDTFGFYVRTYDGLDGGGTITPSNFSAPTPEPATLLLVGGPLVLAGLRRRRAHRS